MTLPKRNKNRLVRPGCGERSGQDDSGGGAKPTVDMEVCLGRDALVN